MAAAMAMDREPEVARFIDSYKYDQDMATRRDRYGGGTSLPLNSDGYEEKQQRLRDERHKDWLVQQDKQRQMEQQKYEARRRSPPRPAQPPGPQMDYNLAGEQARAEERRAYQDYMKAKEERYWAMRGRPVTPPGGLDIGKYDRQLKETAQQKKKEYKEMLDQQKFEQLKLRAMDHVADISPKYVRYRDEERPLVGSPRDINYYMQEQQREHMYLRARQEPEMAVIDRNAAQPSQYLANKPPPGPSYGRGRDESTRQTPAFWNDGRQARGPPSLNSDVSGSNRSTANVPMAFKTESQSQPIPERPRHGQPPYTGAGAGQKGTGGGRYSSESPKGAMAPVASPPRSPLKVDRELLKVPMRDDERPSELGTPLAFKTESQNARYGQQVYPGPGQSQNAAGRDSLNQEAKERDMPPVNLPPRSPEKPANPEWLRVPLRDDERPSELGTPMAFKTDTYSRQPPPAPEQAYSRQPPNVLEQSYPNQQPYKSEQPYAGPSFSRDGQRPVEKYEKYTNGVEGLFGRPEKSPDMPRSRRSYDAERRPSPSKKDDAVLPSNQLSPRRMKNVLYTDSEEVSSKRREASKERQKEYNEFLKVKAEERRRHEEMRQQQQMSKPAELVKNPYYSSDDYEKFQREIQRKQGEEYRDFLAKQKYTNPSRRHDFVDTSSGPYGGLFHGLGEHGNKSDVLNKERQQEYNERLDQQFGKDRPSGRPNWVKETLPNNTDRGRSPMKSQPPADQYQQMLDEKRREEASRRRFEDPEYQDRLAQGRDRGDAGARYGY